MSPPRQARKGISQCHRSFLAVGVWGVCGVCMVCVWCVWCVCGALQTPLNGVLTPEHFGVI